MPRAIAVPVRQAIHDRHLQGQDARAIAAALGVPLPTVRGLLRRWAARPAGDDLAPRYRRCGRPRRTDYRPLAEQAVRLRRDHPTWGAGRVRVALAEAAAGRPVPAERTLLRWFHQADLFPAAPGRRPRAAAPRAAAPHAVWQMDAREDIPLRGGRCCWLRLADEFTGAILWTRVFPPGALGRGARRRRPRHAAAGLRPLGAARRPARR